MNIPNPAIFGRGRPYRSRVPPRRGGPWFPPTGSYRAERVTKRNLFVTPGAVDPVVGSLRTLGIVGAALLLVGPALIGAGFANAAYAEHQEIGCTGNCAPQDRAAINASIDTELFFGLGVVVIGVGAGLVFACTTRFMSRWPPRAAA